MCVAFLAWARHNVAAWCFPFILAFFFLFTDTNTRLYKCRALLLSRVFLKETKEEEEEAEYLCLSISVLPFASYCSVHVSYSVLRMLSSLETFLFFVLL